MSVLFVYMYVWRIVCAEFQFLQKIKYAIHISVWSNSKCFKRVIDVILSDSLITFY